MVKIPRHIEKHILTCDHPNNECCVKQDWKNKMTIFQRMIYDVED